MLHAACKCHLSCGSRGEPTAPPSSELLGCVSRSKPPSFPQPSLFRAHRNARQLYAGEAAQPFKRAVVQKPHPRKHQHQHGGPSKSQYASARNKKTGPTAS